MSTRAIRDHLKGLYGIDVSSSLVSAVADAVLGEMAAWQNRPLEPCYLLERGQFFWRIVCMAEAVAAFVWGEHGADVAEGCDEIVEGPRADASEVGLELGEDHLDG